MYLLEIISLEQNRIDHYKAHNMFPGNSFVCLRLCVHKIDERDSHVFLEKRATFLRLTEK